MVVEEKIREKIKGSEEEWLAGQPSDVTAGLFR